MVTDLQTFLMQPVRGLDKVSRNGVLFFRRLIKARRLRLARDREFLRSYNDYCRAHNLSPLSEDQWRHGG